jgi:ubiquinone/menaquinone biosynthesis C-methylase UbiE
MRADFTILMTACKHLNHGPGEHQPMNAPTHFDRRAPTYDADETHRRIIAILVSGALLQPGMRVLDIATGTGAAALKAAEIVGSQGSVLGIDISDGMLAEARRKVTAAGLQNVEFVNADAEQLDLPAESFDFIFCASALVLMRDIPATLHRCFHWLRPNGFIAFDVPAKPFGLAQMVAEAAKEQGIYLPYDSVADSPSKCRALLKQAGFEVTAVNNEVVIDDSIEVPKAIAFLDERLDHPAWRALKDAPQRTRDAIRETFMTSITRNATGNRVPNKVVQNFAYGRKP